MKRKLKWHDLVALGVGGMLGVGVFVTIGRVANHHSGPSVFISYFIAGISTEFSVQIPVAGGAYSYLRVTFGMHIFVLLFFNFPLYLFLLLAIYLEMM
jgi:amino acid transporter